MPDRTLPATREAIAALIPHQGAMCLLESVTGWTETGIVCTTTSHAAADNPLRREGQLAALHLCEYGAQAMALHGALGDIAQASRPGMLVALRDIKLAAVHVEPRGRLEVRAQQVQASASGFQYEFEVRLEARLLASGRAMVMFKEP